MEKHKIKIGLPEIGSFSAMSFQSIVNLKLKFGSYNEEKYGLSFDTKNITSSCTLGEENVMA